MNVKPSATLAITAKAKVMKKQGMDVISFGAGEPDFDTPDYIKEAACQSIKKGETKYTPASGVPDLKKAFAEKLKTENDLEYAEENIIISCGAKHSLYNIIQCLINPGDEVILFSPYWVSYLEQVNLASGVPVIVKTEDNEFKIDIKRLKKKISSKTRLIIINSPQNPSGCIYDASTLEQLKDLVLSKKDLYVISDEIYEKIIFDDQKHISIAQLGRDIQDRTILVNGMSKTYAMTGWRIGFLAAPKEIASAISRLQSHSTSNPTTFCQMASITALRGRSSQIDKMLQAFSERREIIFTKLSSIKGFQTVKPQGAFYIFPKISYYFGKKFENKKIDSSLTFSDLLLEKANVALVPGSAFGCDEFVRLSFAISVDQINKGLDRIKEFCQSLK